MVLVEIGGEVDIATVPEARCRLAGATAHGPEHLVVDLSGVTFMSSHGISLLVGALRHEDSVQGTLHLVGVDGNRAVERLLDLTGMRKVFDVHPDLAALLRDLRPRQT